MTDWIHLRGIEVACIVGILEHERRAPQPLSLDVGVGLSLEAAAGGDLGKTIDYRALLHEIHFLTREGAWGLIESVAAVLLRHLLRPGSRAPAGPQVTCARVRVGQQIAGAESIAAGADPTRVLAVANRQSLAPQFTLAEF